MPYRTSRLLSMTSDLQPVKICYLFWEGGEYTAKLNILTSHLQNLSATQSLYCSNEDEVSCPRQSLYAYYRRVIS